MKCIHYSMMFSYTWLWQPIQHHLRFPATVIVALQMAMLCAMQYPSTMEDDAMDAVENMLKMILDQLWIYSRGSGLG